MLNCRWYATCLGERTWTNLKLVILRDLPNTFSCTCLYSKKTKVEGTLPVLTPGSLNFIESNNITIWSTSFYFIYIFCIWILMFLFYSFYFILYIFFHGKLNKMGNITRWRYEVRMHEVCGILTWNNSPSMEQKMQELSFMYMKQSFEFIQLGSLCTCLHMGPRSVVLVMELLYTALWLSIVDGR